MTRTFTSSPAVRANVPLLIALIGPSTSGKTYSAHRLAKGIQRVQPGPIHGIDTENEGTRMLELAEEFDFVHTPFTAPFGALDYLEAIEHCVRQGAQTIIVDSMSHEHEGIGGLLDQADQEIVRGLERKGITDRESNAGWTAEQKLKRSAWIRPKAARTRLIQGLQQLKVNVIMCFRAKEATDQRMENGKTTIVNQGWVPIGGDAFWYEMRARILLPPGCEGHPKWRSNLEGEQLAIRRPKQFANILRDGAQINEDMGEAMARWATGNVTFDLTTALARVTSSSNPAELRALASSLRGQEWSNEDRAAIAQSITARQTELKAKT